MYRFKDGNTLVNVSNSILNHYGVKPLHKTYQPLDEVLINNKNKKVVLFLFDAFSKKIIEKYKRSVPFIYSHQYETISSVFPPTTAAATTGLVSGLYPSENGYLGWWTYLAGKLATTFSSRVFGTEEVLNPTLSEILKYTSIFEMINEKEGKEVATLVQSFTLENNSMEGLIEEVQKQLVNHQFIYAYLTEPDHSMHGLGVKNRTVKKIVKDIDARLKQFVETHKDTLVISLADHGMIDTKTINIPPQILDLCENRIYSMEGRAASFFVPKEKQEEFYTLAKDFFKKDFEVYTKDQVNELQILGPTENQHTLYDTLLGDFLVVAVGNKALRLGEEEEFTLTANHAGGKEEESLISLCIYNN